MNLKLALFLLLTPGLGGVPQAASQTHTAGAKKGLPALSQLQADAERARNDGRDEEAIQLYQKCLAQQPEWQEGRWYLSTLLYEKERFPEAREELRRFVAEDAQTGPGWALLGMSEYQTRDYVRSLDHLKQAMSLGLGDRNDLAQSVFYLEGVMLTREEQYDNAMNLLMPLVKSTKEPDFLVEPIGLAGLRWPFLPAEIPGDRRELVQMAGHAALAVDAQRQDEAEGLFRQTVEKYPKEAGVHFLYGAYLMDLRPEDGIREMESELKLSPTHVGARLRLAEEYVKEGKLEEALRLAREAERLEPENSATKLILGEALVAKGDLTAGIEALEKARELSPGRVRTHWDLLRAYGSAGRSADAKREKEEIEKLSQPDSHR